METTLLTSISYIIGCLLLTHLFIQWYSKISQAAGLVDQPGGRKVHERSIPLVGGISIITGIGIAALFNSLVLETIQTYGYPFIAILAILLMSVLDDRFDLSAKIRLGIQIGAAVLVTVSGVKIESMFGLFGINEIALPLQYILTVVVLVGSTNAFNLIDGVDGLAGSLALVTTSLLSIIAFSLGLYGLSLFCLGLAAGLVAFLKHNLYPAKIFLGDAGSMTLGFLLTLIAIILLQNAVSSEYSEVIFILIIGALMVPVIDAIRVFLKRYSKGYSILEADRTHLHHLLLHTKGNHKEVASSVVKFQLIFLILGVLLSTIASITFVVCTIILGQIITSKILMINKTLAEWQEQLRRNEKSFHL